MPRSGSTSGSMPVSGSLGRVSLLGPGRSPLLEQGGRLASELGSRVVLELGAELPAPSARWRLEVVTYLGEVVTYHGEPVTVRVRV